MLYSSWQNRSGEPWFRPQDRCQGDNPPADRPHGGLEPGEETDKWGSAPLLGFLYQPLATLLLEHLAEGEKSWQVLSLPRQPRITTALRKKLQSLLTVCNAKSSTSEKAQLKSRLSSRSWNKQLCKGTQQASQVAKTCARHPLPWLSCVWKKARAIQQVLSQLQKKSKSYQSCHSDSWSSTYQRTSLTLSSVRTSFL